MDSSFISGLTGGTHFDAVFFASLLKIILVDIILSGDNSVVIALAVQSLPADKRRKGILIGTGAAVGMRVLLTLVASQLLVTPFIKFIGGFLILWIAIKLLTENENKEHKSKEAQSIWHAVRLILIADASMSIDNVMAVAGASHGNVFLLWFGLALSIPLVVFASSLLSNLMSRFPWIVVLGAILLGWIGGEMAATDHFFVGHIATGINHHTLGYMGAVIGALVVIGMTYFLKRKQKKQV